MGREWGPNRGPRPPSPSTTLAPPLVLLPVPGVMLLLLPLLLRRGSAGARRPRAPGPAPGSGAALGSFGGAHHPSLEGIAEMACDLH